MRKSARDAPAQRQSRVDLTRVRVNLAALAANPALPRCPRGLHCPSGRSRPPLRSPTTPGAGESFLSTHVDPLGSSSAPAGPATPSALEGGAHATSPELGMIAGSVAPLAPSEVHQTGIDQGILA